MFVEQQSGTEANVQHSLPVSGALVGLYVTLSGSPSTGDSYIFTVRVNGADSAITCTIAGASSTTCSSTTCIDIAANALINVESVPTSDPDAQTSWQYSTFRPGVTCADL